MKNEFYNKNKYYTIYALRLQAEDDYIYVGKTTNPRMSAVYSWHLCGHCAATDCYFSKEERPELHILSEGNMTGAQAYQQVVAWVNVFQSAGYALINHEGTLAHAESPSEETLSIIQSFSNEPVDDILKRSYVVRPVDADRKKPVITNANDENETVQMNIRMKKRDKERFNALCQSQRINQREGFSILLDTMEGKENAGFSLIVEYQERFEKLKGDNERLKKQNALLKGTAESNRDQKAEKLLLLNQKGIKDYLQLLFPEMEKEDPLPHYAYSTFLKHLPAGVAYEYPKEEEFFIMNLEAVVWSNSRSKACFVIGTDVFGNRIKLRYYNKWYYYGYHFLQSTWAKKNAQWYVGCYWAKDGAMDMIAGFPVAYTQKRYIQSDVTIDENDSSRNRKQSLDNMILSAQSKR